MDIQVAYVLQEANSLIILIKLKLDNISIMDIRMDIIANLDNIVILTKLVVRENHLKFCNKKKLVKLDFN